jgi:hypothetical protein
MRSLGEARRTAFEELVMAMMVIALLAVLLPALQTETAQTATMQADVDRLVRAAEGLGGTWPSQPPPPVREVAIVARHGKAVVPLLMVLLSDDPYAERDRKRWKVQQQVTLTLSQIYSESQHCGRTYCDGDPPERIGRHAPTDAFCGARDHGNLTMQTHVSRRFWAR